ncbi:hypothetical protein ASG01_14230 [Chryseobacterium sp. Leaf180]|jgi:hypothetical protein|uniref:hypothetical protein n=1 Tax=Chryseobacterium sp. Leaf180 TaxID=1736289 RepID=UPI0006F2C6D8|nr:hypothetical protein [Chryseobacterium sp. Leaf180]KQR91520.1 hypothetical protein ASG01_14230 [Chryseobacterium sp. Leaf180]
MKLKFILHVSLLTVFSVLNAQQNIKPTESIKVFGAVKNSITFNIDDLDKLPKTRVKDLVIYNPVGEIKDILSGMRGVLLKNALSAIQYDYEKPRELNEFYFVLKASDGYKAVFSWNEIYNTEAGNQYFIITEIQGKTLDQIPNRIIFLSAADLKTGRRYIKGLSEIEVKKAD